MNVEDKSHIPSLLMWGGRATRVQVPIYVYPPSFFTESLYQLTGAFSSYCWAKCQFFSFLHEEHIYNQTAVEPQHTDLLSVNTSRIYMTLS